MIINTIIGYTELPDESTGSSFVTVTCERDVAQRVADEINREDVRYDALLRNAHVNLRPVTVRGVKVPLYFVVLK